MGQAFTFYSERHTVTLYSKRETFTLDSERLASGKAPGSSGTETSDNNGCLERAHKCYAKHTADCFE